MSSHIPPSPTNPTGAEQPPHEREGIEKARETLVWLAPLIADEGFAKFMNAAVSPLLAQAQSDALDVTNKTERQRSDAAFQRAALEEVFGWPKETLRKCLLITAAETERQQRKQQGLPPAQPLYG